MHVQELARLGAQIQLEGDTAIVEGVEEIAGRAGDGDRSARLGFAGHRRAGGGRRDDGQPRLSPRPRLRALEQKLGACGADIERLDGLTMSSEPVDALKLHAL